MAMNNPDPYGVIPTISKKSDTKLDRFLSTLPEQFMQNYRNDPSKTVFGSALGALVETLTPGKSALYSKGVGATPAIADGKSNVSAITPPSGEVIPRAPVVARTPSAPVNALDSGINGIYDRLSKLAKSNPENFVKFADTHPGIPGVGYVRDADGRIKTLVENPANKPEEPMTIAQSDALARMITAKGHLAAGTGAREQAAAYQQGILQNKNAVLEETKNKNIQTQLDKFSMNPVSGNPDPEWGYFQLASSGIPLTPEHKANAELAIAPLKNAISVDEKKIGKPLTPTQKRVRTEQYKRSKGFPYDEAFLKSNE